MILFDKSEQIISNLQTVKFMNVWLLFSGNNLIFIQCAHTFDHKSAGALKKMIEFDRLVSEAEVNIS